MVGDRVPYLAYTARAAACEGLLDRGNERLLLASLEEHGRFLADQGNYTPDNHGLFVDLGLLRLTRFLPFLDQAPDWRGMARERFAKTLRGRLAAGVWLEHSSAYQFLAIRSVEDFLRVLGPDATLDRLLTRMRTAAGWFVRPDGRISQLGDSNLDRAPDWAAAELPDEEGVRDFRAAGFAFVRAAGADGEPGYLAVTDGFHNLTHKHADELSFELYDRGRPIVADTGLYDKDPDPSATSCSPRPPTACSRPTACRSRSPIPPRSTAPAWWRRAPGPAGTRSRGRTRCSLRRAWSTGGSSSTGPGWPS